MKVEQKAGDTSITTFTDGHPLFFQVELPSHVRVSDLHDLRYCIDRVLAKLPEKDRLT